MNPFLNMYRLGPDGRTPVPCRNLDDARLVEAEWHHARNVVGNTRVGNLWVSTVFLRINHALPFETPALFETMIFSETEPGHRGEDLYQQRYATWEQAERGHAHAVAAAFDMAGHTVRRLVAHEF